MKTRVYDMNGTRVIHVPADIWAVLGWDNPRTVNLTLIKPRDKHVWRIEITQDESGDDDDEEKV